MASMHASTCNALTIYNKSLLACKIGIFVCCHYYQARQRILVGIYTKPMSLFHLLIPPPLSSLRRWPLQSDPQEYGHLYPPLGWNANHLTAQQQLVFMYWKCSNKRSNWFFTEDWKCPWPYCWGKPGMEVQRPFVSYHLHGVWDILHWKNENNGRNIWTLE